MKFPHKIWLSKFKKICPFILGASVMFFFSFALMAYSEEKFEIPFFMRDDDDGYEYYGGYEYDTDNSNAAISEETPPPPTEEISNLQHIMNIEELEAATEAVSQNLAAESTTAETPLFELYSDSDKRFAGFEISDGVYRKNSESEIAEYKALFLAAKEAENKISAAQEALDRGEELDYKISDLPEPVYPEPLLEYSLFKINPQYNIKNEMNYIDAERYQVLYKVEPFMDFFFIYDEGKKILCNSDGTVISPNFEKSEYTILKARDEEGKTVFENNGKYYTYVPNLNAMIETSFDPLRGERGVPFMYPSYYGSDGAQGYRRYYTGNTIVRWGYMSQDKKRVLFSVFFTRTYNFSEGIGIAYKNEYSKGNRLYFVNEKFQMTQTDFCSPETLKDTDLGYFFFEYGLTRVMYEEVDFHSGNVIQHQLLVDKNAQKFALPTDYTLKSYSNGMILLEKDGKYGFMNYKGEWIMQPIFTYAKPFYEGIAVVGLESGKKALIDTEGNLLTKFRYNYISPCTGGIIALYDSSEGWTILNKMVRQTPVD